MRQAGVFPTLRRLLRGRALPALLLLAAAVVFWHIDATPLTSVRDSQFDRYQRHLPRNRDSEPVIIVGIDSASLVRHGQWPWPRDLVAGLVERIHAGEPLAIGLDVVFAEPDQYSPASLKRRLPDIPAELRQQLPDPDQRLAQVLSGKSTVLAVIGLAQALPGAGQPANPLPAFSHPPEIEPLLPKFASAMNSLRVLEKAAGGEGLINASPDRPDSSTERGVLRRVPTLAYINDHPLLSLPLEMVRQALGDDAPVIAEGDARGMQAIRLGDYRLPTLPNGELLLHFGKASSNYYLSAADVLDGIHPPTLFANKFVIIGLNSTGLQDRIITPLGDSLPGIDVHAQVIESLLAGEALRRPAAMRWLEMGTLLAGGLLMIAIVPAWRPRKAVFSFLAVSLLLLAGGYAAFAGGSWLFDAQSQILLLSPVFISLLSGTLIRADEKRRRAQAQLQESREAAARVDGELDAARRIQMGMLPDPAAVLADEPRAEAAALLESARAVGGDYYDISLLDAEHLYFAIGDVSGKGVPASLFMAISKTLTGIVARRQLPLGEAVQLLERELSRENPSYLFVTAFIAILDLRDGTLQYVCAGHDAPCLRRGNELLRIDTEAIAGPPLCALGDYPYEAGEMRLQAGDLLCLFTDGVSEARHVDALYGRARLEATLAEIDISHLPTAVNRLRDHVRAFEAGEAPADDLTLLLLRWTGKNGQNVSAE